jgi:hypothetical protein
LLALALASASASRWLGWSPAPFALPSPRAEESEVTECSIILSYRTSSSVSLLSKISDKFRRK